jgi:hypothetical protein
MKPRGKPFEIGNTMGQGRPKGSPNKGKSPEDQLLEQWRLPLLGMCLRRASEGHFPSMRLVQDLYKKSPKQRSPRSRMGKIQTIEELATAMERTMGQMERGEITEGEAKTKMQGLQQMGQLFEQRAQAKLLERPPKQDLPEFMRIHMEGQNAERAERLAKAKQEREERDSLQPIAEVDEVELGSLQRIADARAGHAAFEREEAKLLKPRP